jgi:DNA end-binding protein Ku
MRAIWKGAVAFGLVNVPVKLYSATGQHDVGLHQVHLEDAGRVRYRKVCSICGKELSMAEIAKGYETADGSMVVLTDEDLADLPLATGREIDVLEFVPEEQVDPILLDRTYYLEPEKTAAKAYTLLREALASSERMAVVKVALRQRESMAVLRVRDNVICLQTLLWPDEVRAADFPVLETDVSVRPQELAMASSLIDSMAGDFDPSDFEDSYVSALEQLIEAKVHAGSTVSPVREAEEAPVGGEVVDLLAALQRSVESARARSGQETASAAGDGAEDRGEPGEKAAEKASVSTRGRRKADVDAEAAADAGAASEAEAATGTEGAPSPRGRRSAAQGPGKVDAAGDGKAAKGKKAEADGAGRSASRRAPGPGSRAEDEDTPKKAAPRRRAS